MKKWLKIQYVQKEYEHVEEGVIFMPLDSIVYMHFSGDYKEVICTSGRGLEAGPNTKYLEFSFVTDDEVWEQDLDKKPSKLNQMIYGKMK